MLKKITHLLQQLNVFYKDHAPSAMLKYMIGFGATVLCAISIMLIVEYRFFRRESEKMLALQEDYRNYVVAVKKILHDYNKTKVRLEELETLVVEKKKEFEDVDISGQTIFPEGVRVYSTDDEDDEESVSFLIINRELEYLKQSTLDYIKQQRLSYLESRISPDVWRDYTDQVIEKQSAQGKKKKARQPKRSSTKRHQKSYEQEATIASSKSKRRVQDITMAWPIDRSNFWISSPFGPRKKPNGSQGFHYGLDMAAVKGTTVKAAADGVVVEARYASGYGNTVVIAHTGKYRTRYAHLHKITVEVGQKVERNMRIGTVGATGFVRSKRRGGDASHLHFEVHAFGKQVNPIYFLG